MRTLLTWAGRSAFRYSGSVTDGITIRFGRGFRFRAQVSAEYFAALLKRFSGLTVKIGTARDAAPAGSLGAWLREHVTRVAIASYVGPVLIAEGYAEMFVADRIEEELRAARQWGFAFGRCVTGDSLTFGQAVRCARNRS